MQDEVMLLENYSEKHRAAVSSFFAEFAEAGENAREEAFGGFSYTFLYIREADGRLVGMLNLRGDGGSSGSNRVFQDNLELSVENEKNESVAGGEKKRAAVNCGNIEKSMDFGNIGYSIRPSERGKGYGTALVESGLELCDMFGIKNPTAVVKKDNIASRRVLEKNGFVLKKEDGEVLVWEHL